MYYFLKSHLVTEAIFNQTMFKYEVKKLSKPKTHAKHSHQHLWGGKYLFRYLNTSSTLNLQNYVGYLLKHTIDFIMK